ncbi:P-loop containing nucleoside triphosphate hydrolase protein [Chiua virens]|nr:P-loop containing nucleoside triphosphate hydrolase protein [Chiua virens]
MPTVKLVLIGASGVGKTSLRTQYISGRFSTGYRATIGADFIAKTLPHPTRPDDVVTLQIWDTAGQERFSSLSTAFFRGADAALLMFDVNRPESLTALKKWWQEFRERAPLYDEDLEDYCCVVVGNKTDLVNSKSIGSSVVSEIQALRFLDELVPPSPPRPTSPVEEVPEEDQVPITIEEVPPSPSDDSAIDLSSSNTQSRSRSIDINPYTRKGSALSKRASWSSTNILHGTLTSTHTGMTSYHTPSSSIFDVYASARSSPLPPSISSRVSSPVRTHQRRTSSVSSTSSSATTITPSLFMRGCDQTPLTPPSTASDAVQPPPLIPERGPKLFFTSAKTGEGVHEVFEYIARRVIARWEYEEAIDARTLHEPSDTIRLALTRAESGQRPRGSCC